MADNQKEPTVSLDAPFAEKPSAETLRVTCDQCGAVISGRRGSITAWIFGSSECSCKKASPSSSGVKAADPASEPADTKLALEAALPNRYTVLSLIAEGGMGRVYRAFDRETQTEVAVKVLREELVQDLDSVKRFMQEAKASSDLKHPNIIHVREHGMTSHSRPYIAMDYLKGYTLDQLLEREVYVDSKEALVIFEQVCLALLYAHKRGVVHRDIKPSNIMVMRESNTFVVKLIDFGIAKVRHSRGSETQYLTQTGEIFGSPVYMSPEQGLGEKLDARSDIYSLGCVMYETLTGSPPFSDENPIKTVYQHINEAPPVMAKSKLEIPDDLERVVLHCLAKQPGDRYPSVSDLLGDLRKIAQGKEVRVSTASHAALSRAPIWLRILASLINLTAIVAVCCVLYSWFYIEFFSVVRGYRYQTEIGVVAFTFWCGWSASLGKEICGLSVTNLRGERLSRTRSFVRYTAKAVLVPYYFVLGAILEASRVVKRAVMDDAPFVVALKECFRAPIYDRVTRSQVMRGNPVSKAAYLRLFVLFCMLFVPADRVKAAVFELVNLDDKLPIVSQIESTPEKTRWDVCRLMGPSITLTDLFRNKVAPSKQDGADVLRVTTVGSGMIMFGGSHARIVDYKSGWQRVEFAQTTVMRSPTLNQVVIESHAPGHERFGIATIRFEKDDKGSIVGFVKYVFPDGSTGEQTLTDVNDIQFLRSFGNPIEMVWVYRDGRFGCQLYTPRSATFDVLAMVEFLEQSYGRFFMTDRCFQAVTSNPFSPEDYFRLYPGSSFSQDVVVKPGRRYKLEAKVGTVNYNGSPNSNHGAYELTVRINGKANEVCWNYKERDSPWVSHQFEFKVTDKPVVEIEISDLHSPQIFYPVPVSVKDVSLTMLDD